MNDDRDRDYMQMTADLLYELASYTRLSIMHELNSRGEMRLGEIARALNLTMQEAHRNIARLVNSGLVVKNNNGLFALTEYGRLVTRQLGYFGFIVRNRDHLLRSYSLAGVPDALINRLGDLADCKMVHGVSAVLEKLKALESRAEEYLRIIVAQAWYEEGRILIDRLSNGVNVMLIITSSTIIPREILESDIPRTLRRFEADGMLHTKVVRRVGAALYISEKEAGLILPNHSGIFDMNLLFIGYDRFHGWCNDLFMHYWNIGEDANDINSIVRIVE